MKCFHFTNKEARDVEDGVILRLFKVSWVRSLSLALISIDTRRSELESDSKDFTESFYELLSQRRANDLQIFMFAELKSVTRGFSRALMIEEGGFGSIYRGEVRVSDDNDSKLDVAIKQLNYNGFQGHKEWINEVSFLGVVKHPNHVKLVGYCAEDDERGVQRNPYRSAVGYL